MESKSSEKEENSLSNSVCDAERSQRGRQRSTFLCTRYRGASRSVKRYELIAAMTFDHRCGASSLEEEEEGGGEGEVERISRYWPLPGDEVEIFGVSGEKRRHFITASRYRLHIILALPYPLRDSIYSRAIAPTIASPGARGDRRPSRLLESRVVGASPTPTPRRR